MTTTGKKITDFASLTSIADGDILLAVDASDTTSSLEGTTKKVLFSEVRGSIVSGINTSNWDAAYGWGNHASAGYLSNFTETDPVFNAHPSSNITTTKIGQWDTSYGWGNHAIQGYLQSISALSINALGDVDTSGASTNDVLKWNGTSWVPGVGGGVGSVATLNDVGNVTISSASTGQVLKWSGTAWTNQADAGGIALGDLSVTTASAGAASLAYNNTSGAFTYTPPDLSSFITLGDLSVTTASASATASLSYNNGTGEFTYTPPDLSSIVINIVDDSSPQLGNNLDLNSNDIEGIGNINIDGDLKGDAIRLTNNATTPGSGNEREIKVIGQAPYFYDGTDWRPFFLIDAPTQIPADTNWDDVMIRSTFDLNIDDVKYNVTPTKSNNTNVQIVGSPTIVGNNSLSLNGAYLEYDVSDNGPGRPYNFNGAFTMEAWIYFNSNIVGDGSTPMVIFGGYGAANSLDNWALTVWQNSTTIRFSWFNPNNPNHNTLPGTFMLSRSNSNLGEWHHVALVKEKVSGDIVLYWDGSQSNSTDLTDSDILNPSEFRLGGLNDYGAVSIDAVYDDLRISSSDRYSANFTAPTSQLPISGSTTQILPPQADKKLEITLGSSPTIKGSPGVTVSRVSSGRYRLTFASSYSNSTDYYVMAQGMNHASSVASYIRIQRTASRVDLYVKNQENNNEVDDGYVGVQIINHS